MAAAAAPRRRKKDWGAIGFVGTLLAPGLLLYFFLVLWPMGQSFWVALHRWRGVSGTMTFVGAENFAALVQDEKFRLALWHNLQFLGMVGISVLIFGLFFANALAQRLKGVELFRALFLFPNVVSAVAVSLLWMFIYNPNWGLLNGLMQLLEKGGVALVGPSFPDLERTWLADQHTVMPCVAVTYVWYVLGFYVLLFRAGIQNISTDVNEAAAIDGATGSQRFWFVTLPLLSDIVRLAVIYLIINSMNLFALVWVMAPPAGTTGATEVALTYLYQKGFVEYQFGYSTAIGAVDFVLVMAVTTLLQRIWKPREVGA